MIDKKIHVAIKSYKRAGKVRTLKVVPFAHIWVPESQGEEYERYYPGRVITIPDERDGNAPKKFNAILDLSPCPWTMILDDDIDGIGIWEQRIRRWMLPDEIEQMFCRYFELANQFGVKLWGINQNKDELLYRVFSPFNLTAPVLGPFNGHLEPELRYDEKLVVKSDYDFWLLNILKHRKTLRVNRFHYSHDHGKMPGGIVSMRTMDAEKEAVEYMRVKWGDRVFKAGGSAGGKSAKGNNILNSKITNPIPGC